MSDLKSKHAFGSEARIQYAIEQGLVDAYDILFLDEGKIGWITKEGNVKLAEGKDQVLTVSALPEVGEESVVYICNGSLYFWNGTAFVDFSKSEDVSALETQVSEIETELEKKVDAETVQAMIEEHSESAIEVVEF